MKTAFLFAFEAFSLAVTAGGANAHSIQSRQRRRATRARLRTLRTLDERILEDIGIVVRGDIPIADHVTRIPQDYL